MPLSSSEKVNEVSQDLVSAFQAAFGNHPGFRPAHARGILINGSFTPSPAAATLTIASHFSDPVTPILVRFSSSTGLPQIPDTDPNATPHGLAIRFKLGERVHTDVITHSTPYFPTRTGEEFLEFLKAVGASGPGVPSPTPIEAFLGAHPAALAFVTAPKPTPVSLATEIFFGVNALKFVNAEGKETYFRYRVMPEVGLEYLDEAALKVKEEFFLQEELVTRIAEGPVGLRLLAQLAEEGDVVDDATVYWPESRRVVDLGTMRLESVVREGEKVQKSVIFDPVPRVKGIEPSADPLLEVRASTYLISGRERRAA